MAAAVINSWPRAIIPSKVPFNAQPHAAQASAASSALTLPAEPNAPWVKPTYANTRGGETYSPTHRTLFHVQFQASTGPDVVESYSSRLVADRSFGPGKTIAVLTNLSKAPEKAYSSVQYGPGEHDHFELNSDLLFMNHSCEPSAELHLPAHQMGQWEVRAGPRGIAEGEDITFFYPSTEWDMAQGFDCACGGKSCLGNIRGAKYLTVDELQQRGYVNEHIRALKVSQGGRGV